MLYFADKDHDVFGCEYVEKAVIDFFTENCLEYSCEVKSLPSCHINMYKAKNKRITIYQGDLFALSTDIIGKFDAIWDRASLAALHPSRRPDYAQLMYDILRAGGKHLINTPSMTGVPYTGPPYSVSPKDIEESFGKYCNITGLETHEEDPTLLKVSSKFRHVFLLTPKPAVEETTK